MRLPFSMRWEDDRRRVLGDPRLRHQLRAWTREVGAQWDVVRSKLRFVAFTAERAPHPGLGRLQDQASGLELVPGAAVTQISVSGPVWTHFGADQTKVERARRGPDPRMHEAR